TIEELTPAWRAAVAGVAADPYRRAVVVTGEVRAFCAGGALSWLDSGDDDARQPIRLREKMLPFYRTWLAIRDLEVPTIAALNGPAVGAGLALALACDLRYSVPAAKLSVPFTALGLHAGIATSWLRPGVVGAAPTPELLLTV